MMQRWRYFYLVLMNLAAWIVVWLAADAGAARAKLRAAAICMHNYDPRHQKVFGCG